MDTCLVPQSGGDGSSPCAAALSLVRERPVGCAIEDVRTYHVRDDGAVTQSEKTASTVKVPSGS